MIGNWIQGWWLDRRERGRETSFPPTGPGVVLVSPERAGAVARELAKRWRPSISEIDSYCRWLEGDAGRALVLTIQCPYPLDELEQPWIRQRRLREDLAMSLWDLGYCLTYYDPGESEERRKLWINLRNNDGEKLEDWLSRGHLQDWIWRQANRKTVRIRPLLG